MIRPRIRPHFAWLSALTIFILSAAWLATDSQGQKSAPGRASAKPPNIVFIIADDLGTEIGPYRPEVHTPTLSALAARGMRFDRAYCQYPQCNPSRASLLSGRSPSSIGVYNNLVPPRTARPELVYLPSYLRQHGYTTIKAGKILHATFDDAERFDQVVELRNPHRDAPFPKLRRNREDIKAARQERQTGQAITRPYDRVFGEAIDDAEAQWMEDARLASSLPPVIATLRARQPFFLAVGVTSSHLDWVAPRSDFNRYPLEKVEIASGPPGDLGDVPKEAVKFATLKPGYEEVEQRFLRQAYHASNTFMDRQLGELVEALSVAGLLENTWIVFTSDHGQHLGEHGGLWEKNTLFEETARVPLLVAGPGVVQGKSLCVVQLLDLYPTLVGLAGLRQPRGLEGRDLSRILHGEKVCPPGGALTELWKGNKPTANEPPAFARTLRTDRYRFTDWGGTHSFELYDHDRDPGEQRNLATDPAHRAVLEEHRRLLIQRLARADAPR